MTEKNKADLIFWIHNITFLFGIFSPILFPKKYLYIPVLYFIILIIHWKIFGGCILSIAEKEFRNEIYTSAYKGGFLDRFLVYWFNIHFEEEDLYLINLIGMIIPLTTLIYRYTNLLGFSVGYLFMYPILDNYVM